MNANSPNLLMLDVAILVSIAFGFYIMNWLLPRQYSWLKFALTPGAGAGVCALIFYSFRRPFFGIEAVMVVVTVVLLWRKRESTPARIDVSSGSLALLALLSPALVLAVQTALIHLYRRPHGDWDGWAIWNYEARLLFRAGPEWRHFLPLAAHAHGDYPLLVSAITARLWRYMGGELPEVGAWLGIVLALCSIAVLALTLAELRTPILGALMGMTLLGTPSYVGASASQYADVPVGFFFLASLAMIALHFERSSDARSLHMLSAAGFFAGCAGWTKNEGLLFIVAAAAALSLPLLRERRDTLRRLVFFGAGLAWPLLVIITFKFTNPVKNNLVEYGKFQQALMLDRHIMILKSLARHAFSFGAWYWSPYIPVIAFILLIGVHRPVFRSYAWRTIVSIIILVALGYYFVYLTSPEPLQWHIETSIDRLLLQLWPSLLLTVGLICHGNRQDLHKEEQF